MRTAVFQSAPPGAGRAFREGVEAGMVGVNVPVAPPFAFCPFSGWKGSLYGDLHVHGTDGIEFYVTEQRHLGGSFRLRGRNALRCLAALVL